METIETNRLIAEFMSGEHRLAQVTHEAHHNYDTSWDWLMPVVEKIEDSYEYDVEILQYGTRVLENGVEIITNVADFSFDKKIEHCYDAVVEFIKEYNKKN